MPGFLWCKTISGARTAGFYAFQAGDELYTCDGTRLDPPPGSVMLSGAEMVSAIGKSGPKGMYVKAWMNTKDDWFQHINTFFHEHMGVFSALDNAIATITDSAGILSPHNASKEVVAQKKAVAISKKNMIEHQYEDHIKTSLQLLKPMTVRARVRTAPDSPHLTHLT